MQRIKEFSESKCNDFSDNKSRFISSALSRSKRFITLDRLLITNNSNDLVLITDPKEIKQATINHFQNYVPVPSNNFLDTSSFPDRWAFRYAPINEINDSIYDNLFALIVMDEWLSTFRSMPRNKAAGPSYIMYEFLQHLGPTADAHSSSDK